MIHGAAVLLVLGWLVDMFFFEVVSHVSCTHCSTMAVFVSLALSASPYSRSVTLMTMTRRSTITDDT